MTYLDGAIFGQPLPDGLADWTSLRGAPQLPGTERDFDDVDVHRSQREKSQSMAAQEAVVMTPFAGGHTTGQTALDAADAFEFKTRAQNTRR